MATGPSMNMHMIQAMNPHSFWKAVNSIVLLNSKIWYTRVYWPLCIFFNMGVFYHPPGDSLTMGLQITIFVSVFVFTSLVPHRKKIQNLFDGACHPPDGSPPFRLWAPLHPSHDVSVYRMPDRRRSVLGKTNKGRITTTYMGLVGSRTPGPLGRPCGYCIRFTKAPAPFWLWGMWLVYGSGWLDIVAHDGHVNDYYQDDRREHIETNHACASTSRSTSQLIKPTH